MNDLSAIIEIPLADLRTPAAIDIGERATPCRYRLLDCVSYINEEKLRIVEFSNLPTIPYSAVSYVWRGNPVDPNKVGPRFMVQGAPDADPISVDVLKNACYLSLQRRINYLWLDRLSILQENSKDKKWQIKEMFSIYRSCHLCIILPGGIQKLVRLDEETAWIHRGWTLQEALIPKEAVVLFAWESGSGTIGIENEKALIMEVILEHSAVSSLGDLMKASSLGSVLFTSRMNMTFAIYVSIFGSGDSANIKALASLQSTATAPLGSDVRGHAIWKSALLRTSSRPVDMVFSIMGLFGITLDVGKYGKNDRLRATIDLVRATLEKGESASWLGISFRLPPCRELCVFPIFPQTSVAGKALVIDHKGSEKDVADFVLGEYPSEGAIHRGLPKGTMSENGYFTFSTKCIAVETLVSNQKDGDTSGSSGRRVLSTMDESVWTIHETANDNEITEDTHYLAAFIGWFEDYYPGITTIHGKDDYKIRGMIVKQHAAGKYHVKAYFSLHFLEDEDWVMSWKDHTLSVGSGELMDKNDLPSRCLSIRKEGGTRAKTKRWVHQRVSDRMNKPVLPQAFLEAIIPRRGGR